MIFQQLIVKKNPEQLQAAIKEAEIITTAVGPTVLPYLAENLATVIELRANEQPSSLIIIACENMIGGSERLKEAVYPLLSDK